jgi:PAS domain S-box-containing protein
VVISDDRRAGELELLQAFMDSTPDWLFAKDLEHRFLFVNRSLAAAVGREPAEMVGRPDTDFWGLEGCETNPATGHRGSHADDRRAFAGETVRNPHDEATIVDGTVRVFDTVKSPLRASDGRIVGVLCYCRDVTDRERAEEAQRASDRLLRAIVESEPECVKLLDREGRVLEMNPAGLRMIEADGIAEVRGRDVTALVHPDHRPAFASMLRAVFRGESRRLVFDLTGLRGATRTLETHSVPLWMDEARRGVRALLGVTRDITERRAAEQARARLEADLREAHKLRAMGTLAGGIAHDFNNLLTAILGNAELLLGNQTVQSDARTSGEQIMRAAERARLLVRQIMMFASMREQARKPMSIEPVVVEALRLLQTTLPDGVEIRTRLDSGNRSILADATQVHQVVMNVVTNAVHALRDRGGTIEVEVVNVEVLADGAGAVPALEAGEYVLVLVRDDGHGMDAATVERVFEPFFTTKPPGEGSGLGLAVVHGIMQGHDGAVTIDSSRGVGTTVRLYFPVVERAADLDKQSRGDLPRGRGQHLLVVDDEPAIVELAQRLLAQLGYRSTGHCRPVEALEAFRRDPTAFDLVLCDVVMPELSGLELVSAVRAIDPAIPILLVTGRAGGIDNRGIRDAGVQGLLRKPFLARELAWLLRRHLDVAR